MPYKRSGSQFYQIRKRTLPGFGDTGVLSSKVKDRRTAERMEALLEDIAAQGLTDPKWIRLLEAVRAHQIDLPGLLAAKAQRRLDLVVKSLYDPLLTEAIAQYRQIPGLSRQVGYGFDKLLSVAPPGVRLSWLASSRTIQDVLISLVSAERKQNTVRRQVHRAISKLITHVYGKAERNRIFAEVDFAKQDDVREILISQQEIAALIHECESRGYTELATLIRVALLTSADRGVLLAGDRGSDTPARGLLRRDLNIFIDDDGSYWGKVYLMDTKSSSRPRTVVFGDALARELVLLARDKGPDDPVFNMSYSDLDYPWQQVREAIGRKDIRFKDLRAQTAIYAQQAQIPQAVTMRTMGHASERRTRDYQRHEAAMSLEQARALEAVMFGSRKSA